MIPIKNDSKNLEVLDIIAKSNFGSILKCYNYKTGEIVIKKLRYIREKNTLGIPQNIFLESRIYNIIKDFNESTHVLIPSSLIIDLDKKLFGYIMKYYPFNLKEYYTQFPLEEKQIKTIIFKILTALVDLHQNQIIHRNIIPENILLLDANNVVLTDFSSAIFLQIPLKELFKDVGKFNYRSPELIKDPNIDNDIYSIDTDLWNVGCIAVEIILKKPLFISHNKTNLMKEHVLIFGTKKFSLIYSNKIINSLNYSTARGYFNEILSDIISPDFKDLLFKLLEPDPLQRITAIDAIKHICFKF